MKRFSPLFAALGALFTFVGLAEAQPPELPEPLYAETFDKGGSSWIGVGSSARVAMETGTDNIKQGTGALRFNYNVLPGQINALICPIAPPSLGTLQSISFWVKVDHSAPLAFIFNEQNGGRFGAVFTVNSGEWQRVEIAASELVLQNGKDDPADANGTLDLDRIDSAALVDFSQLFAQVALDPASPMIRILGIEMGARTLYLDDLVFSSKPFPIAPDSKTVIDAYNRPQASWFGVGGVSLKTVRGAEPEVNALRVDYSQTAGKLNVFAKLLPAGLLGGKTGLAFSVSSKQRATLIVQLEEKSGGKYVSTWEVPGAETVTSRTFPFAEFHAADDSKDDNNRLDLESVKQVMVMDASGLLGTGAGENTLLLGRILMR
jgi:hypothetical protein